MTDARVNESKRELIPAALLRRSQHHSFMFTTRALSSSQISPHHLQSVGCNRAHRTQKNPQMTQENQGY